MSDYLMLFSISPVQNFISNSRKTQDLYNGSKILSDLTMYQLAYLQSETSLKVIFPKTDSRFLPNRVLFRVNAKDDDYIIELGKKLEKNFHSRLYKSLFDALNKSDKYLQAQIDDYFQSYWSAIKIENSYEEAYKELERKHAGIKNLRMFRQLGDGKGEQGRKCSLCGEYNALIYKNNSDGKPAFLSGQAFSINNNILKTNEAICSICALKRFNNAPSFPSVSEIAMKDILLEKELLQLKKINIDPEILYKENDVFKYLKSENNQESFEEAEKLKKQIIDRCKREGRKLPKYYALIMFDGDNMGKLLSGGELRENLNLQKFHQELTSSLSENAKESSNIVDKAGRTVYTGGDDFLGFCTLEKLLSTLKNLRKSFEEKVYKKLQDFLKPSSEITMSAGVVIAHYKTPLHIVLNWGRHMEQESKDRDGKNSVTLSVLKHSGDIQKVTWNWKTNIDKMLEILNLLRSNKFSTNFIYTLDEEFRKLDYETDQSYDRQFDSELKRLIKRSRIDKNSKNSEMIDQLYEACLDLKYSFNNIDDYFSLMRIIAFLYRESGGEK